MLVVLQYADVAELADALDLGSSVYDVQVQLLLSAYFFKADALLCVSAFLIWKISDCGVQ